MFTAGVPRPEYLKNRPVPYKCVPLPSEYIQYLAYVIIDGTVDCLDLVCTVVFLCVYTVTCR